MSPRCWRRLKALTSNHAVIKQRLARYPLRILALMYSVASPLHAGTATGHITGIQVNNYSHAVLFRLNTEIDRTPKCNLRKQFAIDLTQIGGDALYRLLLDARRAGYVVTVTGLNTCAVHYESEGVKTLEIH